MLSANIYHFTFVPWLARVCDALPTGFISQQTTTGHPTGCPVAFQASQHLRLRWRGLRARRGRIGHHVVLKLPGVGGGVAGLAAAAFYLRSKAATVTEATSETGLQLPALVVPLGFSEVRVSVGVLGAGKGVS